MFRVIRSEEFEKKLSKLGIFETKRVNKIENQLKIQPLAGKTLGHEFL